MAKFAATDFSVTVNGTDLSTSLTSAELNIEADDKDVSVFGNTFRQRVSGLKQGTVRLNFLQDFGGGSVESVVNLALLGTIATVVIKPTSGTVSSTNPSYTVPCLVTTVQPISASVGDVAVQQVSWVTSGSVVKATS